MYRLSCVKHGAKMCEDDTRNKGKSVRKQHCVLCRLCKREDVRGHSPRRGPCLRVLQLADRSAIRSFAEGRMYERGLILWIRKQSEYCQDLNYNSGGGGRTPKGVARCGGSAWFTGGPTEVVAKAV
jgi:hypothetical protein